jgi:hypothetical protein
MMKVFDIEPVFFSAPIGYYYEPRHLKNERKKSMNTKHPLGIKHI